MPPACFIDHASSPDWPVRILRPIVQPFVGAMLDTRHDFSLCRAVGSQLVCDHHLRRSAMVLQELLHQALGVSLALIKNIQDETVLINGAPQPVRLATD
tara:strand:+ start:285 stop:581 length:297 start_codon:yes stop_codon:yes gene_type:complete